MSDDLKKIDKGALFISAILKGVPYVGPSLDHLIYGAGLDLRINRVEKTLKEMGERLESIGKGHKIDNNEDFAKLLEDVIPKVARAPREQKRVIFRNLLVNAARVEPDQELWDSISLVTELIDQVEPIGFEILSVLTVEPPLPCFDPIFKHYDFPRFEFTDRRPIENRELFIYKVNTDSVTGQSWFVKLWKMNLIQYYTDRYDRPFEESAYQWVRLTALGELVVDWALKEQ